MAASNGPDSSYGATPPNQFIPISSTENMSRSSRRPSSGCMIAAVIAFVAFCVIAVIAGAALAMFWFNASPVMITPAAPAGDPTSVAPLTSATATLSVVPTQGVGPTLTAFPTNTLPPTQPASPTSPSTALPGPTSTPPVKPTWLPCTGSYFSRLYVGDIAYVSFDPPLPNRVRREPNTASVVLGMLQPGERMEIIGGPVCSNEWIWWQIRSQVTGLTGWTTEGDAKSYWLVPVR